jgi:hypothetical protein
MISIQDEDTAPEGTYIPVKSHESEYNSGMQLRYSYRLDPWPRHRIAFGKAFGCARVVFNDGWRRGNKRMPPGSRTSPTRRCRPA